jgi:hypothetical protein
MVVMVVVVVVVVVVVWWWVAVGGAEKVSISTAIRYATIRIISL